MILKSTFIIGGVFGDDLDILLRLEAAESRLIGRKTLNFDLTPIVSGKQERTLPAHTAMGAGIRTGNGFFPSSIARPPTISRMVQAGPETLYILMPDVGRSATARQARAASPLQ